MNATCSIYEEALWRTPEALEYNRGRGIPDATIRDCRIGNSDGLLPESGLANEQARHVAERLGLIRRSQRSAPDSFRELLAGRLIVPEVRHGNCIWMIGQSIAEQDHSPKFMALGGERPVLGYERAVGQSKTPSQRKTSFWPTAVSWGLSAFSPCGTSLSSKRAGFLAQTEVIWGVLDADEAGGKLPNALLHDWGVTRMSLIGHSNTRTYVLKTGHIAILPLSGGQNPRQPA